MRLFAASYVGTIATLELCQNASQHYSLELINSSDVCAPTPSWITLDSRRRILYCTEAGVNSGAGTLHSLAIQPDSSLLPVGKISTPIGAAHSALYDDGQAIATAYYYAGEVETYNVNDSLHLSRLQSLTYPLSRPGPYPAQNQSRPHEIIIDPSGKYMLVPDLGADLIRVFRISHDISSLDAIQEQQTIQLPLGSTPRHGAFARVGDKTYFYVLEQNTNKILSFGVDYSHSGSIRFTQLGQTNLLLRTDGSLMDRSIQASEIAVSPDSRFVIASLRNDSSFSIASPVDPQIQTVSDSLVSYAIDPGSGTLILMQSVAAGGSYPRQFSLNAAGNKIAVAVQTNGWVAILERDVSTGNIGKLLAAKGGLGENSVVCVQWDE